MINQAQDTIWTVDGLTYEEVIAQEYNDCKFSAGFVAGHPVDTMYIRLERSADDFQMFLIRPDEAAALAWCLNGVLWADLIKPHLEG